MPAVGAERGAVAAVAVLAATVLAPSGYVATTDDDAEIGRVLTGAQELTGTLLAQKDKLATLFGNADLVVRTITDQRDAVAALFADVNELTAAATRRLSEHGPRFDTLLDQLHTITGELGAVERDPATGIEQAAPVLR